MLYVDAQAPKKIKKGKMTGMEKNTSHPNT